MRELGYRDRDIDLYLDELIFERLEEEERKAREKDPRLLPRTVLINLYVEGIIDERRLRRGFRDLNFRSSDIELLVEHAKLKRAEYLKKQSEEVKSEAEEIAKEAEESVAEAGE